MLYIILTATLKLRLFFVDTTLHLRIWKRINFAMRYMMVYNIIGFENLKCNNFRSAGKASAEVVEVHLSCFDCPSTRHGCTDVKTSGTNCCRGDLAPQKPDLGVEFWSVIDLLVGFFRGAVFHHGGVPGNCPLTLMGPFPSLMGRCPSLTGRFPECLNGPFSFLTTF